MKPDVICILGMHRSGTSFLAGSLQRAGLHLGHCNTQARHNPKGNRENPDFVALNESILRANGGTWFGPPRKIQWQDMHRRQAQALVEAFRPMVPWGFKDPRTLLLLEGWRALIPEMAPVGVFRHPCAVARSLEARRPGFPPWHAYFLWHRYNAILLETFLEQPFPLLCFDWDDELLHERLNEALDTLGLHPLERVDAFFSAELRHQGNDEFGELPAECETLYGALREAAESGL